MKKAGSINTRWFKDRFSERKLSIRKAAPQLGLDAAALSRMLRGLRRMKLDEAAALASVLGVSLKEVLIHSGLNPSHDPKKDGVPVIGWADKDWHVHLGGVEGPGFVLAPLEKGTVALRDQSGSLKDGWLLYYKPSKSIRSKAIGRLCMVELEDTGEKLIRKLKMNAEGNAFYLIGVDDTVIENVRVKSASPILWMRQ
jgi:hypothetical protein